MYRATRQKRSNSLNALRENIDEKLKTLVKTKKLLPSAAYDPGLMRILAHIVQWMPIETRLMHDMTIRAAQNPTRYWSIFNPATHVFYRENLQYAFPVNQAPLSSATPLYSDQFLITKFILKQYPIDEWRKEAKAEWKFYQKQLQVPLDEPAIPTVKSPDQREYRQFEKKQFKLCRYAYFDNDRFLDAPLDSAGNSLQVAKWTPGNMQWIKQPVADHPVNNYGRDNPDPNIWLPALVAPAEASSADESS